MTFFANIKYVDLTRIKDFTYHFILFVFLFPLIGNMSSPLAAFGADIPVFPGAQGFGTKTVAGRGGTVYRVTNLNASGPGSLKAAIDASGPRVVIFEVSGNITIDSLLVIHNPYITIAGQTAPSPGITIRGGTAGGGLLRIKTHDVLIQHLRMRYGDLSANPPDDNGDVLRLTPDAINVVIDHCSMSWGVDENLDLEGDNWTMSNSIVSECLYNSIHSEGPHSKIFRFGPLAGTATINKTLIAHGSERNPLINSPDGLEFINNAVYNWGVFASRIKTQENGFPLVLIGNWYEQGPNSSNVDSLTCWQNNGANSSVYWHDNRRNGALVGWEDASCVVQGSRANSPAINSGVTILPSDGLKTYLTSRIGARPADRDSVDTRIINEWINRSGRIIDSQNDVGGFPALANNHRALTLPSNPNGDDDNDGYTNLEEWLHAYAAEVEGGNSPSPTPQPELVPPTNLRIGN